ncbi:MAG TPA: chloride channel protein [Rhodanobacteraceae bacterium]|nr:chloride channel protein [Rhodanobacteraceae bacterium]
MTQPNPPSAQSESGSASAPEHASVKTIGSTDALPMAPALGASLDQASMPRESTLVSHRILLTSAMAIALGAAAAGVAQLLMLMINLITDICFYGRISDVIGPHAIARSAVLSPAGNHLGAWVIVMPVIGGLLAGIMARWGSRAIQGHGIPEAMERILEHESNIPARVTWLKPLSSAFAIGTGGPFGAEGPIISTGGALGSLLGQFLRVTAQERKVLLAAGAAAGMAAVFGAPVASVVMAVELLLFELRPRSPIPVALACVTATGVRYASFGSAAVFAMPTVLEPGGWALASYIVLGAVVGYVSVWVTKAVYGVEDAFAKLPIHWMWWPALGAVAAGVIGWISPHTLGVGYDNIDALVQGHFGVTMLLTFGALKFVSWVISLGSGTSGGTLAPLFMIGGSLGALIGIGIGHLWPAFHIDPRIAALVGMATIFAGSSRALLTAIVFCFETTRQPATLLPLLGGCTAAYLISALTMRGTIMTEKIERRGVRVPSEYTADDMEQVKVGKVCTREVRSLKTSDELGEVRSWMNSGRVRAQHQGYPVLDDAGRVRGVITRRDLLDPSKPGLTRIGEMLKRGPIVVFEDHNLRDATDLMVTENVGRLIVVERNNPTHMVGVLTRSDVMAANSRRIHEMHDATRHIRFRQTFGRRFGGKQQPSPAEHAK